MYELHKNAYRTVVSSVLCMALPLYTRGDMMGVYTGWVDGYLLETAYGTSLIADASTQTRKLGVLSEQAIHPSPETTMIYGGTGVNSQEVPDGEAWKSLYELVGTYTVVMIDGLLIWLVMGKSSTAGTGPYVHTVTPPTAVSGVLPPLPSITIQHDLTGTATDWGTQYKGVKVAKLALMCSAESQLLYGVVDWIAQTAVNAGFVSTNAPVFVPTALEQAYLFGNMTATFDGASFRETLIEMEFTMSPDFMMWRDTTLWLKDLIESSRKKYTLKFIWSPMSSVFFDELIASGNTKDIVFTWTRSADDYIEMTLTNCHVTKADTVSPKTGEHITQEVHIEPEAVSFEIKDSITGSEYGE